MKNISIPIAVSLVLGILFSIASKTKVKKDDSGSFILEYALAIKLFGIIMLLAGIWGSAIIIFTGLKKPGDGLYMLIFVILFCFVFLPSILCIEFFFVKFKINASTIIVSSPWSKNREIQWKNVTEIKYSPTLRWFSICDSQTKPIRISTLITGINILLETFEGNVPETIFKKAIGKYKMS